MWELAWTAWRGCRPDLCLQICKLNSSRERRPPRGENDGWDHQLADGAVLLQLQLLVMKSNVFCWFFWANAVPNTRLCCQRWPQEVACFSRLMNPEQLYLTPAAPTLSNEGHCRWEIHLFHQEIFALASPEGSGGYQGDPEALCLLIMHPQILVFWCLFLLNWRVGSKLSILGG